MEEKQTNSDSAAGVAANAVASDCKSQIETLEKKCGEYLAGWQRAKADYLNLKKETEGHYKEMMEFANAAVLAELLPIYDNFKLAFKERPPVADDKSDKWITGIEHIQSQMREFFKKFGIEEIASEGQAFDPAKHEAISKEAAAGMKPNMVLREIKPGYTLHGKILSPAKVIVSE